MHDTIHTHTHGRVVTRAHTQYIHKTKQKPDAATAAYAAHQHEAERALAACRAYAARAREARFPTPQVLEVQVGGVGDEWSPPVLAWVLFAVFFKRVCTQYSSHIALQEDDPLERFVLARVIPSHKDPREEMLARSVVVH